MDYGVPFDLVVCYCSYLGSFGAFASKESLARKLLSAGVTGDIKAHQVLLNRVPEQITEDNVWYQNYY